MAKVVITISDDVPGQELSISMAFEPALKTNGYDTEFFEENNPKTHTAAYLAWQAIDDYMGTEPTVHSVSKPIEI